MSLKLVFPIYCSKCGKELPEGSNFCQNCGATVKSEAKPESSVVKKFENDPQLQEHWIKRTIAYLIDSVIVAVATTILLVVIMFPWFIASPFSIFDPVRFPLAMGLVYIVYGTVAEPSYGATFGKMQVGLKVVGEADGKRLSFEKAFMRNVSKIYWVLLFLDVVFGLLTSTDLHQKYSDRIANTRVILVKNVGAWKL